MDNRRKHERLDIIATIANIVAFVTRVLFKVAFLSLLVVWIVLCIKAIVAML